LTILWLRTQPSVVSQTVGMLRQGLGSHAFQENGLLNIIGWRELTRIPSRPLRMPGKPVPKLLRGQTHLTVRPIRSVSLVL